MPLLAGSWKPRELPHRRQVCHQLTQGQRPRRKRSGGARFDKLASHERRDDGEERPEASRPEHPPATANRLSHEHRSAGPRRKARQLGAPRHGSTTRHQHQPDSRVNLEQTAGPDTENDPALGHVRAGDLQLDKRPARHRPTSLASHACSMPARRGGDSCRPTHGEPATLCRTQLDDEASRMPARVGSTPRNAQVGNRRRNVCLVVPANGPHQLRDGASGRVRTGDNCASLPSQNGAPISHVSCM